MIEFKAKLNMENTPFVEIGDDPKSNGTHNDVVININDEYNLLFPLEEIFIVVSTGYHSNIPRNKHLNQPKSVLRYVLANDDVKEELT